MYTDSSQQVIHPSSSPLISWLILAILCLAVTYCMFLLHHKKNQVRKPRAAKRTTTFDERYMGHIPYQRNGDDLTSVDQAMEAHLLFPEQAKVETPSDILWMPPSYDNKIHNARMIFI